VLCRLPKSSDANLLTANLPFADAGVYRLRDDLALVQSVDFFTPLVDDPYLFGQIAAANALSDVYALGGRPLTVLNLVAFPMCLLGPEPLTRILEGSAEKVREAGAVVVGGHSIEDEEPKFGLAVTGTVDPRQMVSAAGCRAGDRLLLTKPLGSGLLTTALKGEIITESDMAEAILAMCTLNATAAQVMLNVGVSACTDITGFGLLGHAMELAAASGVCLVLEGSALPAYAGALEMAAMGLVPQGSFQNRAYYQPRLLGTAELISRHLDLLADPQTSGGLLLAVPEERSGELARQLREAGCGNWSIGWAEEGPAGHLRLV
jgi:selenide, water dikinase